MSTRKIGDGGDEFFREQRPSVASERTTVSSRRTKGGGFKKYAYGALALVIVAAGVGVAYKLGYLTPAEEKQTADNAQGKSQAQLQTDAENRVMLADLSKLMVLPNEEPIIAVVKDAEKLSKEQVFFRDAQNGDKVIIYKERAIIFRPSIKQIVNAGPVDRGADTATTPSSQATGSSVAGSEQTPAVTNPLSLEVRNGSNKSGAAKSMGDRLEKSVGAKVLGVGSAANSNYETTLLVNLTGKDVSAMEKELGITAITALPAGEKASSADVLIVIGKQ